MDELASFNPVTPYGHSKVLAEQDIAQLADDDISPIFLRNATAYGASPRLRVVPGSEVSFADGAGPDKRCYRVDCAKLATTLPELQMRWTVRRGIEQRYQAFTRHGLTLQELSGSRFQRIAHVRSLIDDDRLDLDLRWREYVRAS